MEERSGARPVLGRGLSEEDPGDVTARTRAVEHRPAGSGNRIRLVAGVEGEEVRRIERFLVMASVAGGLAEAVVEDALPRTGHMGHDRVKDKPPLGVRVEPLVHEVMQEATGLRSSVAVGVLDRPGERVGARPLFVGRVSEKRDDVPSGRESQPGDPGVLPVIHEVVEPPRLEPTLHVDPVRVGCDHAVHHAPEAPLVPRNLDPLRVAVRPLHQRRPGIVRRNGWIG